MAEGQPVKKRPRYNATVTDLASGQPAQDAFEQEELSDGASDSEWQAEAGESEEDGASGESGDSEADESLYLAQADESPRAAERDRLYRTMPALQSGAVVASPHANERGTDASAEGDPSGSPLKARLVPAFHSFELDEIETSTDEDDVGENTPDYDDAEFEDFPDDDADDSDDGDGHRDGPPDEDDGGDDAYAQFLAAILAEDAPPNAAVEANPFSSVLDDDVDDDFDYLAAMATAVEDPLEYRDDKAVHVSKREIVQLVSTESGRRTRPRRIAPAAPATQSIPGAPVHPMAIAPAPLPGVLSLGTSSNPRVGHGIPLYDGTAAGPIEAYRGQSPVSAVALARLHQQLNLHVLMLGYVNALAEDAEAKATTQGLMTELLYMRNVTRQYKQTFEPLKREFEDALHLADSGQVPTESRLAAPALNAVESLLDRLQAGGSLDTTDIISMFRPYAEEDVHAKLMSRASPEKLSSEPRDSMVWHVEDDTLLALTIAKHTTEFGSASADLLPHRTTAECERRMRYLSSRRCGDNPVKRQVHASATRSKPLSREEIAIIKSALVRISGVHGKQTSPEVWKIIQRDHLPHRDWKQLGELWSWREKRRAYRDRYNRKRRAQQATHEGSTALE